MAPRRRTKKALVIGGSIAGLYVARLLARQGWETHVFERVGEDLRARGAGIATHPETFAALHHAGIEAGTDLGIAVDRRRVLDASGVVTHDVARRQVMASWATIYALLRDDLGDIRHRPGVALARVEQLPAGVGAMLGDGSRIEGDILIGADGFRSTTRQQLWPAVVPHYAGYIAWRGLVPEERLSHRTRDNIFEHFCFCLPAGEQMAGYPVRDIAEGGNAAKRAYNFIWYRSVSAAMLKAFLTDVQGEVHELSVPPPLVRPQIVEEMRRAAATLLSPEFVDIVAQTRDPFYQPIYDLTVDRMTNGRVALIGDAAFVARPHVGAGVTKAFDDGRALARALEAENIDEGLAEFDAARTPIGQAIVRQGQELGRVMCERGASENRRAEEMMMGSATLEFLSPPGVSREPGKSSAVVREK